MHTLTKTLQFAGLAIVGLSLQSGTTHAAIAPLSDHWQFEVQSYLWAAGIDIEPVKGDDIEITFNDIIDDLDIAVMGSIGARKGKCLVISDLIYMNLNDSSSSTLQLGPGPASIGLDVDVKMKTWINNLGVGYTVYRSDTWMLDVVGGSRFLYLDLELDADIGRFDGKWSETESYWNGFVGLKSQIALTDKLNLDSYVDVGTGDNDLTYQAQLGIHYQLGNWGILAGYRYIAWEFDKSDNMGEVVDTLEVKGPYLGARYTF
jgi:hypothetical protein